MEEILKDLNLSYLMTNFIDNKVGPSEVLSLTDEEFKTLGIETIGERAKLRQRCKDFICETIPESPIVQRVKMFQAKRRRQASWRADNGVFRASKTSTRKIKLGWKHQIAGSFKLIPASKGGGAHDIDAEKDLSLTGLQNKVCELYFPEGQNTIQQLLLSNQNVYLANFSGAKLQDTINGKPFTVDLFYKERKSHPIRVYLHTHEKNEQQTVETADIPVGPNADEQESVDVATPDGQHQITNDRPHSSAEQDSQVMDEELPEIYSGTPTIVFNMRRNLQEELDDQTEPQQHSDENNSEEDLGVSVLKPDTIVADITLTDILERLAAKIKQERSNIVNVSRYAVMQGATRAFRRHSFDPRNRLSVKFVDECGIDEGGPSREFLRLLIKDISQLPIFCGPENSKMLDLNYPALQDRTYELVGQMIAYSIVHGGPLPTFLHPLLYDAMVYGIDSVQPTTDHIMDHDYRDQVVKLSQAEDYVDFEDLIQMAGCTSMAHTLSRRDEMCKAITKFITFGRSHQGFDQFCKGLETLGVLQEVKNHGMRMKELFVYEERHFDSTTVEILFRPELADANSNRRRSEDIVLSNWRDFLLDLEEGTDAPTLKDLLVFVTGADGIPPLGFDPSPSLKFHWAEIGSPEDTKNFPFANTCANSLSLPMLIDYELFKKNMVAVIQINMFTTE